MIEMLGVLAIIGVLSVGGIAGYSKAMMKFKTNKTIDQIAMTVTNIRTLYAQQSNYDLTQAEAYDMGVVDDAMYETQDGTGTSEGKKVFKRLKNAFDGTVYINPAKSGAVGEGSNNGAFILTFTGLPREACVNIATNDWGSNYSSGLLGIGTGKDATAAQDLACGVLGAKANTYGAKGDNVVADGVACATGNSPLRVDQAATGCGCENANTCFVTFKYF